MRIRDRRAAEELEALLEGRVPAEEAGAEARRLGQLASTVVEERPGPVATLPEDRRLLLRDRLLDDIAALEAAPETPAPARPRGQRRPARTAVASALASAMIASTGVAVAAQESLPGDVLYGLKKGTESVRMNLAHDATQAGRLELRFAEERLEEIAVGADRLPRESLIEALAEMDRRSLAGAQQLVLAAEQTGNDELLAEVDAFVEQQSSGLAEIFGRLPVRVRPHAEDSLAVLRQIRADLLDPALDACDCPDLVPASHGDSHPARMTSEPLPAARESGSDEDGADSEASDTTTTDEPDDPGFRQPIDGVTSGGGDEDGSSELEEPVDETGETVEDTLEETRDAAEETTDSVGDLLDGGAEGVEDTTDTVDETTDGVEDVLGSASTTLRRLLGR